MQSNRRRLTIKTTDECVYELKEDETEFTDSLTNLQNELDKQLDFAPYNLEVLALAILRKNGYSQPLQLKNLTFSINKKLLRFGLILKINSPQCISLIQTINQEVPDFVYLNTNAVTTLGNKFLQFLPNKLTAQYISNIKNYINTSPVLLQESPMQFITSQAQYHKILALHGIHSKDNGILKEMFINFGIDNNVLPQANALEKLQHALANASQEKLDSYRKRCGTLHRTTAECNEILKKEISVILNSFGNLSLDQTRPHGEFALNLQTIIDELTKPDFKFGDTQQTKTLIETINACQHFADAIQTERKQTPATRMFSQPSPLDPALASLQAALDLLDHIASEKYKRPYVNTDVRMRLGA